MGRTSTPTYRMELEERRTASSNPAVTRMAWDCRSKGRPTDANLERYVLAYADSLKAGGVNMHLSQSLGHMPIPHSARIVRQSTGQVVASWEAATFQVF